MKTDHTPGPWVMGKTHNGFIDIDSENPKLSWYQLARVAVEVDRKPNEEGQANARLITAAPELLDALQGMLLWAQRVKERNPGPEVFNARKAIRRATKSE